MTATTTDTPTRLDAILETPLSEVPRETERVFRRDNYAPRAARTFTVDFLTAHRIDDDTVDTARLLISETVTNAACYANRGDITVTIEVGDKQIAFTVTDAGRASAAAGIEACEHDDDSEHGRGWEIIRELSAECGIERIGGGNGNRVSFVLDYTAGGAS